MTLNPSLREAMLAAVPSLRAFAISLSGNIDRADDLVQETLLRAIANIDSFQPGTNMSAWMFTILRNLFRSEYRKRRREVEDTDGSYAESLKSHPEQNSRLEFQEFRAALAKLPPDQREALILVGASGFSYEEAAAICECAVGTIKSRVNRARTALRICCRSKAPKTSAPISRLAPSWRLAAAADLSRQTPPPQIETKNSPGLRPGEPVYSDGFVLTAPSANVREQVRRSPKSGTARP